MSGAHLEIVDDQHLEVELEPQTRQNLSQTNAIDPKPPRMKKVAVINRFKEPKALHTIVN